MTTATGQLASISVKNLDGKAKGLIRPIPLILDYRNAKEFDLDIYNLEINTVEFGWIPTTVNQNEPNTEDYLNEASQWLIDNPNEILMLTDLQKLDEAKIIKNNEIRVHADYLIREAYSNPREGIVSDPDDHRNIMSVRRNNKSDKLAGEIALTQAEKDEAKTDQKLSEFEQKIINDRDDFILETNDIEIDDPDPIIQVENIIVPALNWNTWTPPL